MFDVIAAVALPAVYLLVALILSIQVYIDVFKTRAGDQFLYPSRLLWSNLAVAVLWPAAALVAVLVIAALGVRDVFGWLLSDCPRTRGTATTPAVTEQHGRPVRSAHRARIEAS